MQLALFDAVNAKPDEARARTVESKAPRALTRAALDERVHAYTEAAHAANTRRAYRSDWTAFEAWCQGQGECAMPASSSTLARYLAFLADSGKKASTIRRARVAVGLAHGWAGVPRPDKEITIRAVERGIARTRGEREEGADALLASDLPRLVKAFRGGPRDDRDRAVVLLGFAGAFRAGELVALNVEQLEFSGEGLRVFRGTQQGGPDGEGCVRRRAQRGEWGHVPGACCAGMDRPGRAPNRTAVSGRARDRGRARADACGRGEPGGAADLCAGGARGGLLGALAPRGASDECSDGWSERDGDPKAWAVAACAQRGAVFPGGTALRGGESREGTGVRPSFHSRQHDPTDVYLSTYPTRESP